jgi:hypothetical protein
MQEKDGEDFEQMPWLRVPASSRRGEGVLFVARTGLWYVSEPDPQTDHPASPRLAFIPVDDVSCRLVLEDEYLIYGGCLTLTTGEEQIEVEVVLPPQNPAPPYQMEVKAFIEGSSSMLRMLASNGRPVVVELSNESEKRG